MLVTRAAISRAISLALAGTAAASVAAAFAPFGWPFELFSHFRWQLAAAAFGLMLATAVLRQPWQLSVAAATLALHVGSGGLLPRSAAGHLAGDTCNGVTLRVVTANARFTNAEPAALLDWLMRSEADVIALQEVTPAWAAALQPLALKYPYQKVIAREDPYGIALLSRWPAPRMEAVDFAADGYPSLVAEFQVRGRALQVIAMHTHWPVLPSLQAARDRSLQQAAALAATHPGATILLGDLNLTPYAPAFARLVETSGLRDAQDEHVWRPTWQAGFWPLALPIDHVLVPRDACVLQHGTGPDIGSDHRPVQVRLQLP